jgi:branched-chain amino acid transport system substrate-binding protein
LTEPYFNAFKKRWGDEPRGTGNVPSYSVLYMLKEAIERTGSLDVDTLVSAIEQTDMVTAGGRLKFDKTNHQAIYGINPKEMLVGQLLQWQDGKRVCIWPKEIASGEYKLPPWVKSAK